MDNINIGWLSHAITKAQGAGILGLKLRPQAFKLDRSRKLGYHRINKTKRSLMSSAMCAARASWWFDPRKESRCGVDPARIMGFSI